MVGTLALTGATGFAGGHIAREALARGWRVRALVRAPRSGELDNRVEQIAGDLADRAALLRLTEGADCVVHAAGAVAAASRKAFFDVNVTGTANIAAAAERNAVRRLIHISSLAARHPELSAYAASKQGSEDAAAAHHGAAILRPPAVYGPGDRGILPIVQQLTRRIAFLPANARQRFSLIYAEDLARIVMDAAQSQWTGVRDVDDGTPRGYGWDELIAAASDAEGIPIRPVFLPRALLMPLAYVTSAGAAFLGRAAMLSPGKTAELYQLDWVARDPLTSAEKCVTFREGFPPTVAWYRERGWLPERRVADRRRQIAKQEDRAR
jgi:nucleoside-diphosphate-sugar epimerase